MAQGSQEESQVVPDGEEDLPGAEGLDAQIEDLLDREARSIKKEIRLALVEGSDSREDHDIHVSNLIDFCPREFAICDQRGFNYNPGKKVYPGLALTFQIGHAIHRIIQKALAKSGLLRAMEFSLELPVGKFRITGTNDGLLQLMSSELLKIMEIKSISAEQYKDLTEPLINHVCQISLYMWKAEKLGVKMIDPGYGFVIYVCKGHHQDPIKVFPVRRHQTFIDRTEAKVEQLKTFSDTGELPPRVCTTRYAQMAKRCSCKNWCFEGTEGLMLKEGEG